MRCWLMQGGCQDVENMLLVSQGLEVDVVSEPLFVAWPRRQKAGEVPAGSVKWLVQPVPTNYCGAARDRSACTGAVVP